MPTKPPEKPDPHEYPGGATWVDKEFDPNFMDKASFSKRLKNVGVWLRENVLARVIIGFVLSLLTIGTAFVISHLPKSPSESQASKALPDTPQGQHQPLPATGQKQPQANTTVNKP